MTLTIRHVDTCLPSFVLDHCNGETEALVGVPVYGSTTYASLRDDLRIDAYECVDLPPDVTRQDISGAIDDLFSDVSDMSKLFDPSLDPATDDEQDEHCYAWFLVSWEA